jgi:predicted CoA-binding protein
MKKIDKNFVENKEVLFLGVAQRYKMFSQMAYKGFVANGIKVFPVSVDDESYGFQTYKSIDELPAVPKTAYTILDAPDTKKLVPKLKDKGVTKLLFHSANIYDDELVAQCQKAGIEVAASCPLMLYGKGLHRFHGFISGVKR